MLVKEDQNVKEWYLCTEFPYLCPNYIIYIQSAIYVMLVKQDQNVEEWYLCTSCHIYVQIINLPTLTHYAWVSRLAIQNPNLTHSLQFLTPDWQMRKFLARRPMQCKFISQFVKTVGMIGSGRVIFGNTRKSSETFSYLRESSDTFGNLRTPSEVVGHLRKLG